MYYTKKANKQVNALSKKYKDIKGQDKAIEDYKI
jgi:hypothetical protein